MRKSPGQENTARGWANRFTGALRLVAVWSLLPLLSGCVLSIHPWTEPGLILPVAELEGVWQDCEGGDTWVFLLEEESTYRLIHSEDGKPAEFTAAVFELDGLRFMDLLPREPKLNGFYSYHLLPVHGLFRLALDGDTLRLAMLDIDYVDHLLKADPDLVEHTRAEDRLLLTAPTAGLQDFLLRCGEDEQIYGETELLVRSRR